MSTYSALWCCTASQWTLLRDKTKGLNRKAPTSEEGEIWACDFSDKLNLVEVLSQGEPNKGHSDPEVSQLVVDIQNVIRGSFIREQSPSHGTCIGHVALSAASPAVREPVPLSSHQPLAGDLPIIPSPQKVSNLASSASSSTSSVVILYINATTNTGSQSVLGKAEVEAGAMHVRDARKKLELMVDDSESFSLSSGEEEEEEEEWQMKKVKTGRRITCASDRESLP
ncbi:hypothetical protein EI94DRAFT_1701073 [Lactarius quietus]|nr:hypothetical protein EI94DRAFT_1701073 [Lactarius quietus]